MANEIQPASAGTGAACLPPVTIDVQLPAHLKKPRLRSDEASAYLAAAHGVNVAKKTLDKWRCTRSDGPPFQKFGCSALYPRDALDQWALARLGGMKASTSDEGE